MIGDFYDTNTFHLPRQRLKYGEKDLILWDFLDRNK